MHTTLQADRKYGGGKPYIARIVGTDPKFGLKREFVGARETTSGSGRTGVITASISQAGIYEVCDTNKKGKQSNFYLVREFNGEPVKLPIREETVHELLSAFAQGREIDDLLVTQNERGLTLRRDGKLNWLERASNRAKAIEQIRELMRTHSIDVSELAGGQ